MKRSQANMHFLSFKSSLFLINFVRFYFEALIVAGSDGQAKSSYLQKSSLGPNEMKKYPLPLLKLMTRYAEDLIWANNVKKSSAVFRFIVQLSQGKAEAAELRKGSLFKTLRHFRQMHFITRLLNFSS